MNFDPVEHFGESGLQSDVSNRVREPLNITDVVRLPCTRGGLAQYLDTGNDRLFNWQLGVVQILTPLTPDRPLETDLLSMAMVYIRGRMR